MRNYWFMTIDICLVGLFCGIGRRSHHEQILSGFFGTFWPFGVGLVGGWLGLLVLSHSRRSVTPGRVWPAGIVVWLSVLVGGMALRAVAGQGIAASFVAVA
ncbi:MAG: DUF3054 domain-containing protein, partial [Mycobacterium sp.]|nr:DUF3054 domain-containing protein [Mycobacterium sp.]